MERGRSFEVGRPRSRGRKDFGRGRTRGVGSVENWTIFMDVICVSFLSLDTKFQLKPTIFIFWTKFAQKGYFWSKIERTPPLNSAYSN